MTREAYYVQFVKIDIANMLDKYIEMLVINHFTKIGRFIIYPHIVLPIGSPNLTSNSLGISFELIIFEIWRPAGWQICPVLANVKKELIEIKEFLSAPVGNCKTENRFIKSANIVEKLLKHRLPAYDHPGDQR